jgi:hypothetical protein
MRMADPRVRLSLAASVVAVIAGSRSTCLNKAGKEQPALRPHTKGERRRMLRQGTQVDAMPRP